MNCRHGVGLCLLFEYVVSYREADIGKDVLQDVDKRLYACWKQVLLVLRAHAVSDHQLRNLVSQLDYNSF